MKVFTSAGGREIVKVFTSGPRIAFPWDTDPLVLPRRLRTGGGGALPREATSSCPGRPFPWHIDPQPEEAVPAWLAP